MLRLDFNLLFTIINLIVFFLLLKHFLFKPLENIMDQRAAMIQKKLDHAAKVEQKAIEQKQQYETSLANAKDESRKIIAEAKKQARIEADSILAETKQEVIQIRKDTKAAIEQERKRETQKLQKEVAGIAFTAVQKILSEQTNEKENQSLYNQFLKEAGEYNDTGRA